MGYSKVEFVPVSAIRTTKKGNTLQNASLVCHVNGSDVANKRLASGWELIQFITHHSAEEDATAVVAVLGKPRGYKKK